MTWACGSLARPVALRKNTGPGLLAMAPWLMKFLSVAGTAAMFLVGGGIHGIPVLHHATQAAGAAVAQGAWAGCGRGWRPICSMRWQVWWRAGWCWRA